MRSPVRTAAAHFAVAALLVSIACTPGSAPTALVFNVRPTSEGARVEVQVDGGPDGTVWVGFGVGPGVLTSHVERVSDVRAEGPDGGPLPIRPHGYGGWEIDAGTARPWHLSYALDLRADAGDVNFYRASVRGADYLVLVGSDAWPRLYGDERPLSFAPDNRPPGRADTARVTLDVAVDGDWEVVATAEDVTRRSFRFVDHPATTVMLAGRFAPARKAPGLILRVHDGWDVLSGSIVEITQALTAALQARVGAHSERDALGVMLPLPEPLRPSGGLRTAGMVRDRTVLLYGGLAAGSDRRSDRIEEAMAVFIGHELFHLYVPSALPVTRELSWMSEGWAMHMGRLAALDRGYVDPDTAERRLQATYRRYLDMGGYRAGSLPAASMGSESQRDLLYLRGELVFRLLAREWQRSHPDTPFEEHLWRELTSIERVGPLEAEEVSAVLETMVGADVVRRYVVGTAPLTHGVLGLER